MSNVKDFNTWLNESKGSDSDPYKKGVTVTVKKDDVTSIEDLLPKGIMSYYSEEPEPVEMFNTGQHEKFLKFFDKVKSKLPDTIKIDYREVEQEFTDYDNDDHEMLMDVVSAELEKTGGYCQFTIADPDNTIYYGFYKGKLTLYYITGGDGHFFGQAK
jgi:hypothetical protein